VKRRRRIEKEQEGEEVEGEEEEEEGRGGRGRGRGGRGGRGRRMKDGENSYQLARSVPRILYPVPYKLIDPKTPLGAVARGLLSPFT
jgi:hypothetical protein